MENENVDFSDMIRSFVNNDFELYIKVLRAVCNSLLTSGTGLTFAKA
jgi:hypothetical protein